MQKESNSIVLISVNNVCIDLQWSLLFLCLYWRHWSYRLIVKDVKQFGVLRWITYLRIWYLNGNLNGWLTWFTCIQFFYMGCCVTVKLWCRCREDNVWTVQNVILMATRLYYNTTNPLKIFVNYLFRQNVINIFNTLFLNKYVARMPLQ